MKKLMIIIAMLFTTMAFADTVHVFVPISTQGSGYSMNVWYKEIIYKNLTWNGSKNGYTTSTYTDKLYVTVNGRQYIYSDCQWWSEPDSENLKK